MTVLFSGLSKNVLRKIGSKVFSNELKTTREKNVRDFIFVFSCSTVWRRGIVVKKLTMQNYITLGFFFHFSEPYYKPEEVQLR